MAITQPLIDQRDQQKLVDQLKKLILNYCPEWQDLSLVELDANANALIHIFARMMEISIQHLNKIPEKNLISFLDMAGISLAPPQMAKVPLVFTMAQGASQYGFIPAGTQVASAPLTDGTTVVFETEKDLTVILPQLQQIVSLNPKIDCWNDQTAVLLDRNSQIQAEIFHGQELVPRQLFLGHRRLFGLKEPASILLKIELANENSLKKLNSSNWSVNWYCYTDGIKTQITPQVVHGDPEVVNLRKQGTIRFPYLSKLSEQVIQGKSSTSSQIESWSNQWIFAELNCPVTDNIATSLPRIQSIKAAVQITGQTPIGTGKVTSDGKNIKGTETIFSKLFETGWIIANNQTRQIKKIISDQLLLVDNPFDPPIVEATPFIYLKDGQLDASFTPPVKPELGFFNNNPIDLSKDFYPFGERPKFNDTFYFGSKELFSKNGAKIKIVVKLSPGAEVPRTKGVTVSWEYWNSESWNKIGETTYTPGENNATLADGLKDTGVNEENKMPPTVKTTPYEDLDYKDSTAAFTSDGEVTFNCPKIGPIKVNNEENYWVRVRIIKGDYGKEAQYLEQRVEEHYFVYEPASFKPPVFQEFSLAYQLTPVEEDLESIITFNDFQYLDNTPTILKKEPFYPFQQVLAEDPVQQASNICPALYLAFDQDVETLPVTIFFPVLSNLYQFEYSFAFADKGPSKDDTQTELKNVTGLKVGDMIEFRNSDGESEQREISSIDTRSHLIFWLTKLNKNFNDDGSIVLPIYNPPVVAWEYWNGGKWTALTIEDGTKGFIQRGLVQFLVPDDVSKHFMFGKEFYWLRARLEKGSYEMTPTLSHIYTNTVWAHNLVTLKNEILGSSNGEPDQIFTFSTKPVLAGQVIMVKETALTELERKTVYQEEGSDAIREVKDSAGNVLELWVRWHEVKNFNFSGPNSRHYIIDHNQGLITFGDMSRGMIPPADKDNIKCSLYQSGGGIKGNVRAGALTKLRTTIPYIDSVTNPEAADGGSEAENLERVKIRGPQTIKNRDRAVTYEDYEWLIRESYTKVAKVKCLPTTGSRLRFEPGRITIVIVPEIEGDPKPYPSQELLSEIEDCLTQRGPSDIVAASQRIRLIGPDYVRVGINTSVTFVTIQNAKTVEGRIIENLKRFLHPLQGGLDKQGWEFGRNVYISEIYTVIEGTEGVDHIDALSIDSSVQCYTIKLTESFTPVISYPRFSSIQNNDGTINLMLLDTLPENVLVESINVRGFREGNTVTLHNKTGKDYKQVDLLIVSLSGNILECQPSSDVNYSDYKQGFILETTDVSISSVLLQDVIFIAETGNWQLIIAELKINDSLVLIHKEDDLKRIVGIQAKKINIEAVFLSENDLVYSGDHTVNKIEGPKIEDGSSQQSTEIEPIIPGYYYYPTFYRYFVTGASCDFIGIGGHLLNIPSDNINYYHYLNYLNNVGYLSKYVWSALQSGNSYISFDFTGIGGHLI